MSEPAADEGMPADPAAPVESRIPVWPAVGGGLTGAAVLPSSLLVLFGVLNGGLDDARDVLQAGVILLAWVLITAVPAASLGAWLALRLRSKRHAEWPRGRTAAAGAFVTGLVLPACCLPTMVLGVG